MLLPLRHLLPSAASPLRRFSCSTVSSVLYFLSFRSRRSVRFNHGIRYMDAENLLDKAKRPVSFRLCKVSGFTTEVLEIHAENPALFIVFIPGNPGVSAFYKDFMEVLYGSLEGKASITAIGHISHTSKVPTCHLSLIIADWESRKLFSLQEQIDHKLDFITQELQNVKVPIILVGHSIGSYISLEILKKSTEKVIYCIGLYPFLALNTQSSKQISIGKLAKSSILSTAASLLISSLGLLPKWAATLFVSKTLGYSWSATAVEAACTHLRQYHCMRNVLFMAMTEFTKLSKEPDWEFMRENQSKLAFLYGIDDHWGPLQTFEEISKQAPGISLSIEREGHTHGFCCTVAGSTWVAHHTAALIKNRLSSQTQ